MRECLAGFLSRLIDYSIDSPKQYSTELAPLASYREGCIKFVPGLYRYQMVSTSKDQHITDATFRDFWAIVSICGSDYASSRVNLLIVCQ